MLLSCSVTDNDFQSSEVSFHIRFLVSQPYPLSLPLLPYYSLFLVQSNYAEIDLLKLIYLSSTKYSLHFPASNVLFPLFLPPGKPFAF